MVKSQADAGFFQLWGNSAATCGVDLNGVRARYIDKLEPIKRDYESGAGIFQLYGPEQREQLFRNKVKSLEDLFQHEVKSALDSCRGYNIEEHVYVDGPNYVLGLDCGALEEERVRLERDLRIAKDDLARMREDIKSGNFSKRAEIQAHIDQLERDKRTSDARIANLQEQLNNATGLITRLEYDQEGFLKRSNQLDAANDRMNQLQAALKKCEEEKATLEGNVERWENQQLGEGHAREQAALEMMQAKDALQKQLVVVNGEMDRLKGELATIKASNEGHAAEIAKINQERDAAQAEYARKLKECEDEKAQLTTQINELKGQLGVPTAEVEELRRKLAKCEQDIAEARKALESSGKSNEANEAKIRELEEELRKAKIKRDALQRDIESLRAQLSECQVQLNRVAGEKQAAMDENAKLLDQEQRNIAAKKALEAKLRECETDLELARTAKTGLEASVVELNGQLRTATAERAALVENNNKNSSEKDKQLQDLRTSYNGLMAELETAKANIVTLENAKQLAAANLRDASSKLEAANLANQKHEAHVTQLDGQIAQKDEDLERTRAQLRKATEGANISEKSATEKDAEVKKLETKVGELEGQLVEKERARASAQQALEKSGENVAELERKMGEVVGNKGKLEQDLANEKADKANIKADLDRVKQEGVDLRGEIEKLKTDHVAALAAKDVEIAELSKQLAECLENLRLCQEELAKLKATHAKYEKDCDEEKAKLNAKIKQLEEDLDKSEASYAELAGDAVRALVKEKMEVPEAKPPQAKPPLVPRPKKPSLKPVDLKAQKGIYQRQIQVMRDELGKLHPNAKSAKKEGELTRLTADIEKKFDEILKKMPNFDLTDTEIEKIETDFNAYDSIIKANMTLLMELSKQNEAYIEAKLLHKPVVFAVPIPETRGKGEKANAAKDKLLKAIETRLEQERVVLDAFVKLRDEYEAKKAEVDDLHTDIEKNTALIKAANIEEERRNRVSASEDEEIKNLEKALSVAGAGENEDNTRLEALRSAANRAIAGITKCKSELGECTGKLSEIARKKADKETARREAIAKKEQEAAKRAEEAAKRAEEERKAEEAEAKRKAEEEARKPPKLTHDMAARLTMYHGRLVKVYDKLKNLINNASNPDASTSIFTTISSIAYNVRNGVDTIYKREHAALIKHEPMIENTSQETAAYDAIAKKVATKESADFKDLYLGLKQRMKDFGGFNAQAGDEVGQRERDLLALFAIGDFSGGKLTENRMLELLENISEAVRVFIKLKVVKDKWPNAFIQINDGVVNLPKEVSPGSYGGIKGKECFGPNNIVPLNYGLGFDVANMSKETATALKIDQTILNAHNSFVEAANDDVIYETVADTIKLIEKDYSIVMFGSGYSGSGKTYTLTKLIRKFLEYYGPGRGTGDFTTKSISLSCFEQYGHLIIGNEGIVTPKSIFDNTGSKFEESFYVYSVSGVNENGIPSDYNREIIDVDKMSAAVAVTGRDFLGKMRSFTLNDIETMVKNLEVYRRGPNVGTIKSTINNEDSSRSHFYYFFDVIFAGGARGKMTFVDMGGQENSQEIFLDYMGGERKVFDYYFDYLHKNNTLGRNIDVILRDLEKLLKKVGEPLLSNETPLHSKWFYYTFKYPIHTYCVLNHVGGVKLVDFATTAAGDSVFNEAFSAYKGDPLANIIASAYISITDFGKSASGSLSREQKYAIRVEIINALLSIKGKFDAYLGIMREKYSNKTISESDLVNVFVEGLYINETLVTKFKYLMSKQISGGVKLPGFLPVYDKNYTPFAMTANVNMTTRILNQFSKPKFIDIACIRGDINEIKNNKDPFKYAKASCQTLQIEARLAAGQCQTMGDVPTPWCSVKHKRPQSAAASRPRQTTGSYEVGILSMVPTCFCWLVIVAIIVMLIFLLYWVFCGGKSYSGYTPQKIPEIYDEERGSTSSARPESDAYFI